jgi:predicted nucleic acid-binding protein
MNLIIDASVLVKFFVPEVLSSKAEQLLALATAEDGSVRLFAPDLIYAEAGNTLWKKHRLKELSRSEIDKITDLIISIPLKVELSKALFPLAIDIAIAYQVTVYDALYLSMAKVYETQMLTADKKLFDLTSKTNLKKSVMWLGSWR